MVAADAASGTDGMEFTMMHAKTDSPLEGPTSAGPLWLGRKAGQAMIEMVVALVAIIVLFAAIIQIGRFASVEQELQSVARRRAGELSLSPTPNSATPDYIELWNEGADGSRLTRDDVFTQGSEAQFKQTIVESGAANPADWAILDQSRDHPLARLRASPTPVSEFGLVYAAESETVDLLPGVRNLLYRADAIDLESKVWLGYTRNIY